MYPGLLLPAVVPFTVHWYTGAGPPLRAAAENETEVPAQTGFADALVVMLTGNKGFTVMVTGDDNAGFPTGQVVFEVSSQIIISPLTGEKEYREPLPELLPLIFHW